MVGQGLPNGAEINMTDAPLHSSKRRPPKIEVRQGQKIESAGSPGRKVESVRETILQVGHEQRLYQTRSSASEMLVGSIPETQRVAHECPAAELPPHKSVESGAESFPTTQVALPPPPHPRPQPGPSTPHADSHEQLQNELRAERERRENAEHELLQKKSEVEDIRKRWKQAARELNKLQAQSQNFYQVTDTYLIDLIMRLRYNISSFAIQHFSGSLQGSVKLRGDAAFFSPYLATTTRDCSMYNEFLGRSDLRPSIIQAFLWNVLVHEVFGNFRWADEAVWKIVAILEPGEYTVPSNSPVR